MSTTKDFHVKDQMVYHNNSRCPEVLKIAALNRIEGTGNKVLCQFCKELNEAKK